MGRREGVRAPPAVEHEGFGGVPGQRRTDAMLAGANTIAKSGGGALELLEHVILLDAGRDDDARGDTEPLAREVDLLGGLGALELVDRQRVAVDAASTAGEVFSGG